MGFKWNLLVWNLLAWMIFSLSSCAWLREPPKGQKSFNTSALDLSCLTPLSAQMQNLFSGNYTNSEHDQNEIRSGFNCLDKALDTFSHHTQGATPGFYTQAELLQFANRYLDSSRAIKPSFFDSVFRLKISLLGGSNDRLTQDEINQLRSLLASFKTMFLPLAPHIHTLLSPKTATSDEKQKSALALKSFVKALTAVFQETQQPILWGDLSSFLTEFEVYTQSSSPTAITALRELMPLIQYFKLLLVGGNDGIIEQDKWEPILDSLANIYNAVSFSADYKDLLQGLSLTIESSSDEQQRAVTQITEVLKALRANPKLYTHDAIATISTFWAESLLGSALLFPATQGTLAINEIFSSSTFLKIAGSIAEDIQKADGAPLERKTVLSLSEHIQSLLQEATLSISPFSSGVSIRDFKTFSASLAPLISDSKKNQLIQTGFDLVVQLRALTIGKTEDQMPVSDFQQMIQKATNLYSAWYPVDHPSLSEKIGRVGDALAQAPYPAQISAETLIQSVDNLKTVFGILAIQMDLPWENFTLWIKNGVAFKALLFHNDPLAFTHSDVNTLITLLAPFRTSEPLELQMNHLSEQLKEHPFFEADLNKVTELLLPIYQHLEMPALPFDLNAKNISLLKGLLLTTDPTELLPQDYSLMAQAAALYLQRIDPLLKKKPLIGFNSDTIELADQGIQALIDFQKQASLPGIDVTALRDFILLMAPKFGLSLEPRHLEEFLIGFDYRVLQGQKGNKPSRLGGRIAPEQLSLIKGITHRFLGQLQDIERVYTDSDRENQLIERKVLRQTLTDPLLQKMVMEYTPQLKPKTHILYQPKLGQSLTRFGFFDLAIRALCYDTLAVIFPAYQLESDPGALQGPRLTLNDTADLLEDADDLLRDLDIVFGTKTPLQVAKERLLTVNVFTTTGNGDEYYDLDETTDFLSMTIGAQIIFQNIRQSLAEACFPHRGWKEVKEFPGTCLVPYFFDPAHFQAAYGESLPQMTSLVNQLKPDEREAFTKSVLVTVRPDITESSTFTLEDLQNLVLFPEYFENLFNRLDANRDGIIQFSEAMSGFPLFCDQVQKAAKGKLKGSCAPGGDPNQIEAIFGYMIIKGQAPRGIKPGDSILVQIREGINLLKWFHTWAKLDKTPSVRDKLPPQLSRKDLVFLLATLAESETESAATAEHD